jgi:hypothetical protein
MISSPEQAKIAFGRRMEDALRKEKRKAFPLWMSLVPLMFYGPNEAYSRAGGTPGEALIADKALARYMYCTYVQQNTIQRSCFLED